MQDDDPGRPDHGWCVQVFLLSDHATALRIARTLELELGEPTTAICVDGARWPVVVVETVDDPSVVTAAARLCRAIEPTSMLTHCSGSRPWSFRQAPDTDVHVQDIPQPA